LRLHRLGGHRRGHRHGRRAHLRREGGGCWCTNTA
jgi:hypothetical protein